MSTRTSFRKADRVIVSVIRRSTAVGFSSTARTERLPGALTGRKRTVRGRVEREVLVDESARVYPWASTEWAPDTFLAREEVPA